MSKPLFKFDLRTLVQVSILIAMEIVLSRFASIATPVVKIGFGFVPIAICAMFYGPVWAGIAGALADFIGAMLFPIGAFFPGFTLSAALTGVIFGLFLYKQAPSWGRLVAAVCTNSVFVSLGLGTLWLSILMGTPYFALLPTRLVQNLILVPLQIVIIRLLQRSAVMVLARRKA